jgi:hypothetical protein
MDFVNFRQSDVPWSFGIWRLDFDSMLYEFREQAVEPHNAVRHKCHKDAVAVVKLRQIAECRPAIIRCVSVLRLDHVHQNDIPCKYLWYIAMKTNFGNKEGEDKTWPFDTMTARVHDQMKDFQQIIKHKIFGEHCIPPSERCWNVIAYLLFAQ